MSPDLRILVVGGGIAGLAAARALTARGFAPEVVERHRGGAGAGLGIYLPGNAVRALRALGVELDGTVQAQQRFCDEHGALLFAVDLDAVWAGVGPCVALPWADLHAALGAGVAVRAGVGLTALTQSEGRVAAEFDDGGSGVYDLVIGADGVHSTVRRLVFGVPARPVGQVGWRFVTAAAVDVTTWSVLLGRGAAFLTIPIGDGRVYCYADVVAREPVPWSAEPFAGFGPPVPELLASDQTIHTSLIEEVRLEAWSSGSVLLVGDAAHASSPNMAEGAAMALEDALVLAACLSGHPTLAAAFAAFEARRRPRTDWVLAQTHRRDPARGLAPPVRNPLLRVAGRRIYRANYAPLRAA